MFFCLKKTLYFNELTRFGQFVKYMLFGSPFLLSRVSIGSPFHSKLDPHWVPIENILGPHAIWKHCVSGRRRRPKQGKIGLWANGPLEVWVSIYSCFRQLFWMSTCNAHRQCVPKDQIALNAPLSQQPDPTWSQPTTDLGNSMPSTSTTSRHRRDNYFNGMKERVIASQCFWAQKQYFLYF